MENNVIIIGLTPQGLSVLRVLSRAGTDVVAFYISKKNVGVHSKYGTKILFNDIPDLKNKIHELVRKLEYKPLCYITSGELLALILREYKELYEECEVISGPFEVVELLAHKDKMYEIARKKGFEVSSYKTLDKYVEGDFNYPLFIKRNYEIPLFFKAACVKDKDEMQSYLEKIHDFQKKDIIVQNYIDIPKEDKLEISAQVFYDNGSLKGCLISEQYRRLKKGLTSMIIELDEGSVKNKIKQMCMDFMSDLQYTGMAEFEFILNKKNNELFFVEVNTRTCGLQSSFAHKFYNLAEILIDPHNGTILQSTIPKIKWMNITRDIRARLQKKDFRKLYEVFLCKYDILDFKDPMPYIRQLL